MFLGLKIWLLVVVVAALLGLRLKGASMLTWAIAWTVAIYALVRYGFVVPVPAT